MTFARLSVLLFALPLAAQTPLVTAASGTSCSAALSADKAAIEVACEQDSQAVLTMRIAVASLLGSLRGASVTFNDVALLFKRQQAADSLHVEASINQYDAAGKPTGQRLVVQRDVPLG